MGRMGLAAQRIKHVLGFIRRILRYGVKQSSCSMPENHIFATPKVDNKKSDNRTAEQLAACWKALGEEPDQNAAALLRLALLTGIGRGALFAPKWSDIDFEYGLLTLHGEATKKGTTEHIPINEAALKMLHGIDRKSEFVFSGKDGGQRKVFTRVARKVREKAGLAKDFSSIALFAARIRQCACKQRLGRSLYLAKAFDP